MTPLLLAASLSADLAVVDRPLPWPDERTQLSVAYWDAHYGDAPPGAVIVPRVIVLHWTGGASLDSAWNTFAPTRAADARPDLAGHGDVNVSAHFLVDRDGTVFRLMPEDRMARHVIGLNHTAIGIENVGDGAGSPLTDAQVAADAALVRALAGRWPITHLIGHYEYRELEGTPLFAERDPRYRTGKADPGEDFMRRVRAEVADLGLAGG